MRDFSIGDIVEIIDETGSDTGKLGDRAMVNNVSGTPIDMVYVTLLTGPHIGKKAARYWYRYKKVSGDWDL